MHAGIMGGSGSQSGLLTRLICDKKKIKKICDILHIKVDSPSEHVPLSVSGTGSTSHEIMPPLPFPQMA